MKPHPSSSAIAIRACLAGALSLVVGLSACGPKHRGEPQGPRVKPDTVAEARGEWLFSRYCYKCHPGGGAGLGPSLNDKPLPELAIRTQIRKGVGAMPAFGANELRDVDVDALAKYVQELRGTPATAPHPRDEHRSASR
jgi:mono/diheme cytochrome c family protein